MAAQAIVQVVRHSRSLNRVMPEFLPRVPDSERALLQELVYGVIRWYPRLDFFLGRLLQKPMKGKDQDMAMLVLVGLYQLAYLRIKPHAAVNETVDAAKQAGKGWACKLINGVLRNFQRQQDNLTHEADRDFVAHWAHPAWLIDRLQQDWPDDWQAILKANNHRAPMTLRNNERRQSRDEYLNRLQHAHIEASALAFTEQGILLQQPVEVTDLPGFNEGAVSVQDGGAQLAAQLLNVEPGMRVLDACAAPGGKTCHILERQPGLKRLLAVDVDNERLASVQQNLDRLQLSAQLKAGDASQPDDWWDDEPFDRILLDVPCSATGVIRRHADIKLLRQASDIDALVSRQAAILEAVWPTLASGGSLLYATCSVLKAENERQVRRFLNVHADASESTLDVEWGIACEVGRQLLPAMQAKADMDGFYYALLSKA